MKPVLSIVRRELQASFSSPIAYAFMAVFLIVAGAGFYYGLRTYVAIPGALAAQRGYTLRTFLVAGRLARWLQLAMLLSLPGLSMRLLSEERKSGTIELLFTSPITTAQIVLGKYLGTLVVYGLILVLTFPYPAILFWKGSPELGALLVAYLGMFLYGAVILAIGLFASSLTENQFVALVVAYALLLPFLLLELLVGFTGPVLDAILAGLSMGIGLRRMGLGLVETHSVILFGALVFTFLFLCTRVLDSGRWR